jgi:predicted nucleic acid-binding protein
MMVLVDTPVWSIALRRKQQDLGQRERAYRDALEKLILEGRVALLGVIRQELLSGIREDRQFLRLRNSLRMFPDVNLTIEDYEEAARLNNICRAHGIAGGAVDYLICAAAVVRKWPIITLDQDFARYAKVIPIRLIAIA